MIRSFSPSSYGALGLLCAFCFAVGWLVARFVRALYDQRDERESLRADGERHERAFELIRSARHRGYISVETFGKLMTFCPNCFAHCAQFVRTMPPDAPEQEQAGPVN